MTTGRWPCSKKTRPSVRVFFPALPEGVWCQATVQLSP